MAVTNATVITVLISGVEVSYVVIAVGSCDDVCDAISAVVGHGGCRVCVCCNEFPPLKPHPLSRANIPPADEGIPSLIRH